MPYHPGALKYYKEHNIQPKPLSERAAPAGARRRPAALAPTSCRRLLLACIVGWVLDVPRRLFGVSFYTEQLLAVCLGLGLALSFVARRDRAPHWLEWLGAVASLGICVYITVRYEPLPTSSRCCRSKA